jgi:hypothetical protein
MAGLFGLFGGNNDDQPKGAYFLEEDTARSEGDRDYIRESKKIRRTFPKSASGGEEFEIVKEVSSQEKSIQDSRTGMKTFSAPTTANNPAITAQSSSASETSEAAQARRKADNSMDMFRNMAKDIRR